MYRAAGEHRNKMIAAISSSVPKRTARGPDLGFNIRMFALENGDLRIESTTPDTSEGKSIDRDISRSEIRCETAGQVDDAGARRPRVGHQRRATLEDERVDNVDNGSEAVLDKHRTEPTAHVPGAVQIEVNDRPPPAIADPAGPRGKLAARIVHDEVNPAERLDGGVAQSFDLLHIADVGRDGLRMPPS